MTTSRVRQCAAISDMDGVARVDEFTGGARSRKEFAE
jgi:hypothetical protein